MRSSGHASRAVFVLCAVGWGAACGRADSSANEAGAPSERAGQNQLAAGNEASSGTRTAAGGGEGVPASPAADGGSVANPGGDGGSAAHGGGGAAADGGGVSSSASGTHAGAGHGGGIGGESGAGGAGAAPVACGLCAAYGAPEQTGTIEPNELDALSGLASSRTHAGIMFAHNDHDRPIVYALDLQGKLHARITLTGVTASDIEDIAVGPCGAQSCVYVADIGDNAVQRREYAVLRFVEPDVPSSPGTNALSVAAERFRFTYDDGSHNAEGLMVAPDGTLYIVTKLAPGSGGKVGATGESSVYRLAASLSSSEVARATKLATLPIPASGDLAASASAAHPCGLGFVVRTYNRVYEFRAPSGAGFEAAFNVMPSVAAMPNEAQSEGIDYRPDGLGFVTSGESAHAPVILTACTP